MIIILGCRRSGTTLLRTVLEQHPDLIVHPQETQFIIETWRKHGMRVRQTQAAIERISSHRYCHPAVAHATLESLIDTTYPSTLKTIIDGYQKAWINGQAGHAVIKYPKFVYHLSVIDQLFPQAKYINVIRDPRACVSSQLSRWKTASTWECATEWQQSLTLADRWAEQRPVHHIYYEKLIAQPGKTLAMLCDYLNITYTPKLLDFDLETREYEKGVAKPKRFTAFDQSRLNLWQERLTNTQVAIIEARCADLIKKHGYNLIMPTVDQATFTRTLRREKFNYAILSTIRQTKNYFLGAQRVFG